jgi:hypothetical protein
MTRDACHDAGIDGMIEIALTRASVERSSMLVIWGRNNSVNVQKALWCCEEIGRPYKRIDAGGRLAS